jgi:hypothetical protein
MGRVDFKKTENNEHSEKKEDKYCHKKCEVWGCTRMGHVNAGKWHCRYHWACHGEKIGDQLNNVTLMLNNHSNEVDWYEFLLQTSFVDFGVGVIDCTLPGCETKRRPLSTAPVGLHPEQGEEFYAYRNRIETHINHLLKLDTHKLRPVIDDGKSLASGEKFNNFGDFVPGF